MRGWTGGLVVALATVHAAEAASPLRITNSCPGTIWMQSLPNAGQPALPDRLVSIPSRAAHDFSIPGSGWNGRFWPKTGCNAAGRNCSSGDSETGFCPPYPTICQPPSYTKIEFFFPPPGSGANAWYDISLVDGYSVPFKITPRAPASGSCIPTQCNLSLDACPGNEILGLGSLKVQVGGKTVMCLSPCKKWNYPAPYGEGKPETTAPGVDLCCPTPPVSSGACQAGPVVTSSYVKTVRASCPTAYSFAYDDKGGLHNCPPTTGFDVVLCP